MPNTPTPPPNCTCASFWTVRQKHKSDCPCATPKTWDEVVDEIFEFVWNLSPHNKHRISEAKSALNNAVKEHVIGNTEIAYKRPKAATRNELRAKQIEIVDGGK